MQLMVNRYKDKLSSIQQKQSTTTLPNPHKPEATPALSEYELKQGGGLSMKKSLEKSKKSIHFHEEKLQSSKRITTPSKHKQKNSKSMLIQKSCEAIFQIFAKVSANDKTLTAKIRSVLQQLWAKCLQNLQNMPRHNLEGIKDLETSMMRQSTISTSAAKRQERLYQDLEKKYFDCQKERHFLKNRIEEIIKKYENVEKELQRYSKIEKLVDNCLEREEETKQQNKRLKQQLQLAELRQVEQQKIFESEINMVRELVEQIKKNLPVT